MSRKYQNPPIVEALCEFRFTPNLDWPLTIHGSIFEKLRGKFPKVRNAKDIQFNARIGPSELAQRSVTRDKTVLLAADEKLLVQIAPHLLVINQLQPYQTWNHFSPVIQEAFQAYQDVAHPEGLQQIIVRYINRVEFEPGTVPLDEYFEFRPYLGPSFKSEMNGFIQAVQFVHEDGRDLASVRMSTTEVGSPAVILDLDYSAIQPDRIGLDNVFGWIETAHSYIENLFEACITDKLRQRFGISA